MGGRLARQGKRGRVYRAGPKTLAIDAVLQEADARDRDGERLSHLLGHHMGYGIKIVRHARQDAPEPAPSTRRGLQEPMERVHMGGRTLAS